MTPKPNEILTAGAEWFRDEANAEDEETQAFEDMLTVGLGWTETLLDYMADPEGAPRVVRLDPLEMCWDSHAHRKGLAGRHAGGAGAEYPARRGAGYVSRQGRCGDQRRLDQQGSRRGERSTKARSATSTSRAGRTRGRRPTAR